MDWLFFIGASAVLTLAPGPDIMFLTTQALNYGPRAGLAIALGLTAGNLGHTLAAALGISLIFRQSPFAFRTLQMLGVAYLLYLAWQAIRSRIQNNIEALPKISPFSLFKRGVLMNLLNPKVALFFLAFLPQFADPALGSLSQQMIALGLVFALIVLVLFGSIGLLAGYLGQWMQPYFSQYAHYLPWLGAGIFVALAMRLALI